MADRVVDRLLILIGYKVDKAAEKAAIDSTKKVEAEAKKAEDSAEKRRENFIRGAGGVAFAVSGAVVALAAYTTATAEAISNTVKQGRELSLTAEQFTEWQFIAERTTKDANAFGESMNQLTERLRSAASGSKEAIAPFAQIGVAVKNADGSFKTAAEILPEIADGLNGITDQGLRAQLSIGVLGESGAKLRGLLDLGSEGIERMRLEARELGAVISDETGARAEELTASVTNLSAAFGGIRTRLTAELMPTLLTLSKRLTAVLTDSDGIVRTGLDRAVRAIGHAFSALESPVGQAALALTGVAGIWAGAQATMSVPVLGAVSKGIVGVGTAFKGLAAGAAALLGLPLGVFAGFAAAAAATVGTLNLVWDEFVVTAQGGDSVIRRVADSLGVGAETAQAFAGSLAVLTGGLSLVGSLASQVATGIGAIATGLISLVGSVMPYLQPLIDGLYYVLGAMPRGIGMALSGVASFAPVTADGQQKTALGSALAGAGSGLQSFGSTVQAGPQAALKATLSGFGQAGQAVGGSLSGMAAAENRKAAGLGPASSTTNNQIVVNIDDPGATPEQIAMAITREMRASNAALEGM